MAIDGLALRIAIRLPGGAFCRAMILLLALASLARGRGDSLGCVAYTNDVVPSVPWSIHVVKIDRARQEVRFCTTLGGGKWMGMGAVSDQLKAVPAEVGTPLAAINGDFYGKANWKMAVLCDESTIATETSNAPRQVATALQCCSHLGVCRP